MPVLAIQQFRCKTCRDTGVITLQTVAGKNPYNNREPRDAETDKRTGQDYRLVANDRTRFVDVEVRCVACPPEPARKRDWER